MDAIKLRIKIGEHTFACQGPDETVKAHLQTFINTIATLGQLPVGGATTLQPQTIGAIAENVLNEKIERQLQEWRHPIHPDQLSKVFNFEPGSRPEEVWLKVKIQSINPELDNILVLLYGIQAFTTLAYGPLVSSGPNGRFEVGDRPVSANTLLNAARTSGLELDRIDRVVSSKAAQGLVYASGSKRGSAYALTIDGKIAAQQLLNSLIKRLK